MDKYPVLAGGETVGELTVEAAASDTVLDMSCVRREGLWCAWAVGESGVLRIGIPEPEGDRLHLRRRFSRSMTAPIGRILRGELRMPERATPQWLPVDPAAPPVRSERFLRAIQARQGVLTCRVDGRLLLAFPRADDAPFPLEELFCFASFRQIKGSDFWIFAFDDAEWPVFLKNENRDTKRK